MSQSDEPSGATPPERPRSAPRLLKAFGKRQWPGPKGRKTSQERKTEIDAWSAENAEPLMQLNVEDAKQLYDQVCVNVRTTDDISFKLLGFVPLVSGSGIVVLLTTNTITSNVKLAIFIGVFGAVVTFGLYRWELKNVYLCHWLIRLGADLEENRFHLKQGQFLMRHERAAPPLILGFEIQKPQSESIIYWAAIVAWLSLPLLVKYT